MSLQAPKKPWEGPWGYTSPYNWNESIRSKYRISENVELYDASFRDGEELPGVVFSIQDKIDIAIAMSDWGIKKIEIPARDFEALKELTGLGLQADIYAFSRAREDDVQNAIDWISYLC